MYMYINKLGSRSYSYIHMKSSYICVIHLVLERCCFEAVLPKKRLRPLGVKVANAHYTFMAVMVVSTHRSFRINHHHLSISYVRV